MVAKVNFDVTAAIEEIEILNNQKVSEEKNWCWIGKLTMLYSNISIVLSNLKIVFLIVNPSIMHLALYSNQYNQIPLLLMEKANNNITFGKYLS